MSFPLSPIGFTPAILPSSFFDDVSDYAYRAELLATIQDFGLENEKNEDVKKIISWCAEKFGTDEYRKRVLAAKTIINCYALNGSELNLSNNQLTSLPELNLPRLERLALQHNPQLQNLPSSLANSSLLAHIDITNTQIPSNRVDAILAVCREQKDKVHQR